MGAGMVVAIVTSLQAGWVRERIPAEETGFSVLQKVQISSMAHLATIQWALGFLPEGQVARAWCWSLTST